MDLKRRVQKMEKVKQTGEKKIFVAYMGDDGKPAGAEDVEAIRQYEEEQKHNSECCLLRVVTDG